MQEARDEALVSTPTDSGRGLRLVSRFTLSSARRSITSALAEGHLRNIDQVDLLSEESLTGLAPTSLYLLLGSGAVFVALDIVGRQAQHAGTLLGSGGGPVLALALLAVNVVAYIVMLPLHEALHAAVILALGGSPRFGLKLPFAAYCTAPGQIFTRNGYLVVAMAPLIALSLVGAAATWFWPNVGSCIVLGLAGNVSGAVGDLASTGRLLRLPSRALVTDTDTGYVAYVPHA